MSSFYRVPEGDESKTNQRNYMVSKIRLNLRNRNSKVLIAMIDHPTTDALRMAILESFTDYELGLMRELDYRFYFICRDASYCTQKIWIEEDEVSVLRTINIPHGGVHQEFYANISYYLVNTEFIDFIGRFSFPSTHKFKLIWADGMGAMFTQPSGKPAEKNTAACLETLMKRNLHYPGLDFIITFTDVRKCASFGNQKRRLKDLMVRYCVSKNRNDAPPIGGKVINYDVQDHENLYAPERRMYVTEVSFK